MPTFKCGKMRSGCLKSGNGFHKCQQVVTVSAKQNREINQGGRIDGPLRTDFCKNHICDFCERSW